MLEGRERPTGTAVFDSAVAESTPSPRGPQSGGVEDQPQCRGLWHSSSPRARSLSRSPSPPPPSFTQSPSPPRSLVSDGQTSPHRPRLVVSHSTCPPLSPSPHANSFIIGTAVINTKVVGGGGAWLVVIQRELVRWPPPGFRVLVQDQDPEWTSVFVISARPVPRLRGEERKREEKEKGGEGREGERGGKREGERGRGCLNLQQLP
jgi:hypothetical protein